MIDTKALRSRILDLAIQGKLTEQLPSDGTAEELYQQIQAEKQALVNEGKIKKEKPLPEISADEIPFEIPSNWKWSRIGQVLNEVIVPQRDKPSFSGNIPWCRIEDKDDLLLNGTKSGQFVSKETVEKMNLRIFPIGTVLSACSGASIGTILITTVECCTNQTFNGLVCSNGLFNWYLLWYLKSAINKLKNMGTGSAMAYISQDRIRNMPIPFPPLAEQKRIVERVEEIFRLLDTIDKAQEKYSADSQILKAKLITAGIQGKLTKQLPSDGTAEELYQQIQAEKQKLISEGKIKKEKPLPPIADEEIPFEIPSSWKWVRLSSTGITQTGNTPSKTHSEYFGNFIPFIGPGDINNGVINYTNHGLSEIGKDYGRICSTNSIVQVCIGGSIGKTAITKQEIAFNQQINSLTSLMCNYKYIYSCIVSDYFISLINNKASGMATPIINKGMWEMLPVPLPPLAEQKRIADVLERALGEIS